METKEQLNTIIQNLQDKIDLYETVINYFKNHYKIDLHSELCFDDINMKEYSVGFICIESIRHEKEFLYEEVANDEEYDALKEVFIR